MDNSLYEMIFKRKSFHFFENVGNEKITEGELNEILSAYREFTPLDPAIKTAIRIVPGEETDCGRGEEYCILLYSEKKDGYLRNIGYLGELLDLYLAKKNIGALWYGLGKTADERFEDMNFVIMIAIRKIGDASAFRRGARGIDRKPTDEIWQGPKIDGVSDVIGLAPSARNSQPWFVLSDGGLSVYRRLSYEKMGAMPPERVAFLNRIDVGIFLCFLDICLNNRGIAFERKLFRDDGGEGELTLNAVYKIALPDPDRT
ncbi:MAG: nitroreductase [Clostridia bacterium]|nr:nitroreductase [Clostridia bacterium]